MQLTAVKTCTLFGVQLTMIESGCSKMLLDEEGSLFSFFVSLFFQSWQAIQFSLFPSALSTTKNFLNLSRCTCLTLNGLCAQIGRTVNKPSMLTIRNALIRLVKPKEPDIFSKDSRDYSNHRIDHTTRQILHQLCIDGRKKHFGTFDTYRCGIALVRSRKTTLRNSFFTKL